jgi:hypothetical protein
LADDTLLHGNPNEWAKVEGGCVPYRYNDPIDVNDAKVGSGEEVELDRDKYPPLAWELPSNLPGEPISAVASALAPDKDGDGEPDGGHGPYQPAPPPPPCGEAPPGTFALVRLSTRGQEFDTVPGIGTTVGSLFNVTRIINHDASHSENVCLDLRKPEQTVLKGVRVKDGAFEFTTWFEVTLDYRLPNDARTTVGSLQSFDLPFVGAPSNSSESNTSVSERTGRFDRGPLVDTEHQSLPIRHATGNTAADEAKEFEAAQIDAPHLTTASRPLPSTLSKITAVRCDTTHKPTDPKPGRSPNESPSPNAIAGRTLTSQARLGVQTQYGIGPDSILDPILADIAVEVALAWGRCSV